MQRKPSWVQLYKPSDCAAQGCVNTVQSNHRYRSLSMAEALLVGDKERQRGSQGSTQLQAVHGKQAPQLSSTSGSCMLKREIS